MPATNLDNLSPFGRLAVMLDGDFSELDRISGQFERMDIETDSGLERAVKLLEQFAVHGQSIGEAIQGFSESLQTAREKSEAAALVVAERAKAIEARKRQQSQLQDKLGEVERQLRDINAGLAAFRKTDSAPLSDDEKSRIAAQLEKLHSQLADFIGAAQMIKQEAAGLKFKGVERETDSLLETLQAARRKLSAALNAK